jgi:hypothetical protein
MVLMREAFDMGRAAIRLFHPDGEMSEGKLEVKD